MWIRFVICMMLFAICSSLMASDGNWRWRFNSAYFGTQPLALDGFDEEDQRITQPPYNDVYVGTYHQQGVDGWIGDDGFYNIDLRASLSLVPGEQDVWTFYLWADPAGTFPLLSLSWGYSTPVPAFDKMQYRLTYVRAAEGITEGPAVGTSVLLNDQGQGTWSLPMYRTSDGLTGYMFELAATVIPEPFSLLALGGGLMGLAGLARRRRVSSNQ